VTKKRRLVRLIAICGRRRACASFENSSYMRSILLALVITLAIALPAVADRDGYYCVGPDYLAMEFRPFSTPGLAGPHVVEILHFDQDAEPRWAGEVILEDFQPTAWSASRRPSYLRVPAMAVGDGCITPWHSVLVGDRASHPSGMIRRTFSSQ